MGRKKRTKKKTREENRREENSERPEDNSGEKERKGRRVGSRDSSVVKWDSLHVSRRHCAIEHKRNLTQNALHWEKSFPNHRHPSIT